MASVGAYDVDFGDELTRMTESTTYGNLTWTSDVKSVPLKQNCSVLALDVEGPTVPCGLELPHDAVSSNISSVPKLLLCKRCYFWRSWTNTSVVLCHVWFIKLLDNM